MNGSTSLSDEDFLARFIDATLPRDGFGHRGHLRAAWLLLQRLTPDEAVTATCDGIARLANRLGAPETYHRTLSEALVRLMAARGGADPGLGWDDFLSANPDLVRDARALLARHYSDSLLESPDARRCFVPPDRLPLPT